MTDSPKAPDREGDTNTAINVGRLGIVAFALSVVMLGLAAWMGRLLHPDNPAGSYTGAILAARPLAFMVALVGLGLAAFCFYEAWAQSRDGDR